jgi:DNA-binding NtrC family response regulator
MAKVRAFARRAARVDAPVLILGETGTGKSLLARAIHQSGQRASGPFVAVNCAGIPESLFESEFFGHHRGAFTGASEARRGFLEQSRGGSLFLDEVGELSVPQQAKLLMALEEGEIRPLGGEKPLKVDVRFVAATSRNLVREMREGEFRRELFHRLAVLTCHIPPLRERREDVPLLTRRIIRDLTRRHGREPVRVSPDGLAFLESRPWPGNIRELAHLLEATIILTDEGILSAALLEATERLAGDPDGNCHEEPKSPETLEALAGTRYSFPGSEAEEREVIRAALARYRGNKSQTARALGMARNTLRHKLRQYDLDRG